MPNGDDGWTCPSPGRQFGEHASQLRRLVTRCMFLSTAAARSGKVGPYTEGHQQRHNVDGVTANRKRDREERGTS